MWGNGSSYGLVGDLRLVLWADPCVFNDVWLIYVHMFSVRA